MILSWVFWTLLSLLNYYNCFKRCKDKQTRYSWRAETHSLSNHWDI